MAQDLIALIGKTVTAPEAEKTLAQYPGLRPESGDIAPDEGVAVVNYLRSERDGVLIKITPDGEVLAVFFMSEGKDGSTQFKGPLPGGLTFASNAGDAVRQFGKPAYRRAPGKIGSLAVGELLRYDLPGHSLHFQFRPGDDTGIDLVTAMAAHTVPGRSVRGPTLQ
jgi:hypothetical protein